MLKLIIEDDEGRKTVVPLVRDELEITIGRQEGNTIRLTERNVSRRHARLLKNNNQVLIEDLGSYNGIRINGGRISGQVQVGTGDLIQIGDYDLAIEAEETARSSATTLPLDPPVTRKLPDPLDTLRMPKVEGPSETADEDVRDADDAERVPTAETNTLPIDQESPDRKPTLIDFDPNQAPRLVVLNTDFAGREFACNRTEMKIGRTDDNEIALDHRSLSRTHCRLVREPTGEWRVIDNQSANGLMVNGESYAQVTLRPGDIIELGHVKLKFVGPGEPANIAASSAAFLSSEVDEVPRSKAPLMAIALLLIILGGGYGLWRSGLLDSDEPAPKPPAALKPDPAKGPSNAAKEKAQAALTEATAAAALLDWPKAELLAQSAAVDGNLLPEAKALLLALEAEKGHRAALEQATKFLDSGDLDKARTSLEQATGTKLLRVRFEELSARREKLVLEMSRTKVAPPRVEPRKPPHVVATDPKLAEAEGLFQQGRRASADKEFQKAAELFEKCAKVAPKYHPCLRLLGSTYANLARINSSSNDNEKGRQAYERFLEVAPPDDEYVPKVRSILEQAKNQ